MLLLESLTKIALSSVFYQRIALDIVSILMLRYNNYNELFDHWRDSVHSILQTLVNIQARFAIHRHHLRNEQNNFFNRLALRKKGR